MTWNSQSECFFQRSYATLKYSYDDMGSWVTTVRHALCSSYLDRSSSRQKANRI